MVEHVERVHSELEMEALSDRSAGWRSTSKLIGPRVASPSTGFEPRTRFGCGIRVAAAFGNESAAHPHLISKLRNCAYTVARLAVIWNCRAHYFQTNAIRSQSHACPG